MLNYNAKVAFSLTNFVKQYLNQISSKNVLLLLLLYYIIYI